MNKPNDLITAEFLWTNHRSILGGRSSVSGAELPMTLAECGSGPQGAHWGMAAAVARLFDLPEPPLPPGVTEEAAAEIRMRLDIKRAG